MKVLLLIILSITLVSCQNQKPQQDETIVETRAPGYVVMKEKKSPVYEGNPDNLDLWDKYIEAHNERNLELISKMNSDSISITSYNGNNSKGNENHINSLKTWFESSNPKWETFFSYTMKIPSQKGEWIISGHKMTETSDGKEVVSYDILDAYIENDKVQSFWVYNRK